MATRSGSLMGGGSRGIDAKPTSVLPFRSTAGAMAEAEGRCSVADADLRDMAQELTDSLLELRGVGNVPATGDPYTDRTRNDLQCGKAKPVKMLLSQLIAAATDSRIPLTRVRGWLDLVWQVVKLRRREVNHEGFAAPSDLPLLLRAMRSEAVANESEAKHLADPANVTLLKAHIRDLETEVADDLRILDVLRARVAQLTLCAAPASHSTPQETK